MSLYRLTSPSNPSLPAATHNILLATTPLLLPLFAVVLNLTLQMQTLNRDSQTLQSVFQQMMVPLLLSQTKTYTRLRIQDPYQTLGLVWGIWPVWRICSEAWATTQVVEQCLI